MPVNNTDISLRVLSKLPGVLREKEFAVTAVLDGKRLLAVEAGNTVSSRFGVALFLGIDPTYLAPTPFIPALRQPVEAEASELNIGICQTGRVFVLPNVAGYVGSDTVAVMLATNIHERKGLCLALDIGTNGELVLAGQGRLLTCSTAAGPAFEGAQITHGMRATDGAIEGVKIAGDVELKVIGSVPPLGICGSGLIEAIAEMLEAGIINSSGRFIEPDKLPSGLDDRVKARIRKNGEVYEFLLVSAAESATGEDIVLTQKDIREFQLAKGAIGVGVKVLLK